MDYRISNVHTDVYACDCTRGYTGTRKRVCSESSLREKSPLPHRGLEPTSAACRSNALPSELLPAPVKSYISVPAHRNVSNHRLRLKGYRAPFSPFLAHFCFTMSLFHCFTTVTLFACLLEYSSVVERWTRDRKVAGSIHGRRGGEFFFSRIIFLCLYLL